MWMIDHEGTSYVAGSSGVTGIFDRKLYTNLLKKLLLSTLLSER